MGEQRGGEERRKGRRKKAKQGWVGMERTREKGEERGAQREGRVEEERRGYESNKNDKNNKKNLKCFLTDLAILSYIHSFDIY